MSEMREPWPGFTIDPSGAIDLDDAVYPLEDGRVRVFIANVSDILLAGSEEDKIAGEKLFTRYHAHNRDSMLPVRYERVASLLTGRPRQACAITMRLDEDLEVSEMDVDVVPFRSTGQYTYAEAGEMIRAGSCREMVALSDLSMQLLAKRQAKGALALYDLTRGVAIDEDGRLRRMPAGRPATAYILVQELMILANKALAAYAVTNSVPVIFRAQRVSGLVNDSMRGDLLNEISASYASGDASRLANTSIRLDHMIGRAFFTPAPLSHWALNVPFYGPWTSPIRRYPDLVNWRQLLAFKRGLPLPYQPEQLAEVAARATAAQQALREDNDQRSFEERQELRMQLVEQGRVRDLLIVSETEFHKIVRLAPQSDPPSDLVVAIVRRAERGDLPIKTAIQLLFDPERQDASWDHARNAALSMLEINLARAASLLATAPTFVAMDRVRYQWSSTGPVHAPVFSCTAETRRAGQLYRAEAQANNSKGAQQAAALELIKCMVRGETADPYRVVRTPAPVPVEPKPGLDFRSVASLVESGNFVGALVEVCARAGLHPPAYSFSNSGPPHALVIECQASMVYEGDTLSGRSSGRTNKQAKQLAAGKLFEELRSCVVRKAA